MAVERTVVKGEANEASVRESVRSGDFHWTIRVTQSRPPAPHIFLVCNLLESSFDPSPIPLHSVHTTESQNPPTLPPITLIVFLLPFICLYFPWAPAPDSRFHHLWFVARMVSTPTPKPTGKVRWTCLLSRVLEVRSPHSHWNTFCRSSWIQTGYCSTVHPL